MCRYTDYIQTDGDTPLLPNGFYCIVAGLSIASAKIVLSSTGATFIITPSKFFYGEFIMENKQTTTPKIIVDNKGRGLDESLDATENFAKATGLSAKDALRLRLLAEETLAMVRAIVCGFTAEFWLEKDGLGVITIHLLATAEMNYTKKQALIDAATNKKNFTVGIMGKIRELVENAIYSVEEVENLRTEYGGVPVMYGAMGLVGTGTAVHRDHYMWSLNKYRHTVDEAADDEAVKELEKSIVAKLADDVRVSVFGGNAEIIVEKRYSPNK